MSTLNCIYEVMKEGKLEESLKLLNGMIAQKNLSNVQYVQALYFSAQAHIRQPATAESRILALREASKKLRLLFLTIRDEDVDIEDTELLSFLEIALRTQTDLYHSYYIKGQTLMKQQMFREALKYYRMHESDKKCFNVTEFKQFLEPRFKECTTTTIITQDLQLILARSRLCAASAMSALGNTTQVLCN